MSVILASLIILICFTYIYTECNNYDNDYIAKKKIYILKAFIKKKKERYILKAFIKNRYIEIYFSAT
jgi:hypothetical protein